MTAGVALHVGLALAGYAAFLVAGVTGLAFLYEERRLKAKRPALLRWPIFPLETLDRVNVAALWAGFAFFTLGVGKGLWLAQGWMGLCDPKTLFTLVTWGAYAVLLLARATAFSRGPKVAAFSALCLLLVGWTFLGVNAFLGTRHAFF